MKSYLIRTSEANSSLQGLSTKHSSRARLDSSSCKGLILRRPGFDPASPRDLLRTDTHL